MESTPVIPDAIGFEIAKRYPNVSEDEAADYKVWCFHKRPPYKLVIFVDEDYKYAFTEYGDCIGAVHRGCHFDGDGVAFAGDNNICYSGSRIGKTLKYHVGVDEEFWEKKVEEKRNKFLDLIPANY